MTSENGDMWDDAPTPQSIDLTSLSLQEREDLLKGYIDQQKATEIVQRIDGSAGTYEENMRRINYVLGALHFGLGSALKIISVV